MNEAASAGRISLPSFYKEYEAGTLLGFSIFAFFSVLIFRATHHFDYVSGAALAAIVLGWFLVGLNMTKKYGKWGPEYYMRLPLVRVLGTLSVLALGSFFAVSSSFVDFVVSPSQHKTTLTQPVLFAMPFFNDLQTVSLSRSVSIKNWQIFTADGFEVLCSVEVSGIELYGESWNEGRLFERAPDGNINAVLDGALLKMVADGIRVSFEGKSSTEIADPRNILAFKHAMIAPWEWVFSQYGLYWQEGKAQVNYSCGLSFIDHHA